MSLLEKIKAIVPKLDVLETLQDKTYAQIDKATNVAASSPYLVVRVNSCDELIKVVQLCLRQKTAVVIRGAGTGKSGGAIGSGTSVVIDITRLNRILSIDKDNLLAEVEPGVVLGDLQDAVKKCGLYYPPDPASSSMCTIGGNVAENAAGPSTLKYGSTRDYLLGGQAILGTGEVIDFGKRCPKGVAGFDIASLLCGSEGTLAVFTKFILRLLPQPKSEAAGMFYFADEKVALTAVNAILNHGHLPRTLEYIDKVCLHALCALEGKALAEDASALIVETDANYQDGAQKQLDEISLLLKNFSLTKTELAYSEQERRELWQRRSRLSDACTRFLGHKISEDIAVPLGKISEFGMRVKALSDDPRIVVGIFGHAGDGNMHVQIMYEDESLRASAQALRHQVLLLVISLLGTLSAEHGIGLQKKAYLPLEQSQELIALQKRIKLAFDPHYLLNPGKIFDQ